MKKLKTTLIFLMLLATASYACVCAGVISSSFTSFSSHIVSKLQEQSTSLGILNQSVKENNLKLKAQNILLNQELALLQKESLQSKELIFLLKQANHLK